MERMAEFFVEEVHDEEPEARAKSVEGDCRLRPRAAPTKTSAAPRAPARPRAPSRASLDDALSPLNGVCLVLRKGP